MMDANSTGELIRRLRLEKELTQQELAERLNVTDKAVSKWERGVGLPDQSILVELARELGVDISTLLSGNIPENPTVNGNMKKVQVYVCPICGNVITSIADANISCCGMRLSPQPCPKAEEADKLHVELIENELFITTDHEMTKEHYISFVILVTDDTMMMKKLYPQWDMQFRFPRKHGKLIYYCTKHGLMYQLI